MIRRHWWKKLQGKMQRDFGFSCAKNRHYNLCYYCTYMEEYEKNVMKYEIHASPLQTAETEILKKDSHFDIREI